MKKTLGRAMVRMALGIALLGISGAAGAVPAAFREPQSLKAEWTFAEGAGTSAADSSGNGVTATLANGAAWTLGKIGTAVQLDGVNDYIALPANMSVAQNASAVSLTAWVNLSSLPASGVFRELVSLSINAASPTNTSRIALSLVGDGTAADIFAGARSQDAEAQKNVTATTANLGVGTWYHVAAVFDFAGNTIKVYRNGILLVTQAVTFASPTTANTPCTNGALGAQDTGDSNYFHGALDEVKIYSRVLSTSEIERLATGDGLRAQWKLDEGAGASAADASGNAFDATLQGGPAWTTGQMGGALSFDGVDDRVSLGSNQSILRNVNAATVSAWIKPGATIPAGAFRELISISVNSGSPTNSSRVALALQGNGTAGNIFAGGRSTDTETQKTLADASSLAVAQWVHVAAVLDFSGKTITIYRNGAQTAIAAAPFLQSHTPNTVSTNGALGAQDTGDSNFFNGLMDDVRVYGRALSANEISDLVMRDCLMGYWKFDEGTGTSAADASGNGVTATLSNGAAWGTGQFGGAVSLDGVNDYVALPANSTMLNQANAATLSAWVKLSSLPASGAFRELISISVNSANPTNTSRAALSLSGDGAAADVFAGARSTDAETQQNVTANANLGVGVFTHLAAVFDFAGNSIKIYVNGALSATALVGFSQPATANTPSRNGALGAQDMGDSNYFHGLLDEVRVYCRALTSAEILALATVAVPGAPTGLQATAGDTKVTLSWNAVSGATSYNVYRRLQGQSTFGPAVASATQATYINLGLTNGTTYEYVVSAVNGAGEGAASSPPVPATPTPPAGQPPVKPTLVTLTQTTNDNTPDVVGKADPNVTVTVFFKQGATTVETLTTSSDFLGNWSVTAGTKANGAYTVTARASNAFGNSPDSDPITITIDTVAPTIASVSSTSTNGTYTTGGTINVTVTFSEAVTLTGGNLQVTLNTGATVAITPFGPATTASGTYTVQAGQNTAHLSASSPLTLGGSATLLDAGGNAASLTVPAGQNLGDLKNFMIDTLAPFVMSVTSSTADGTYGAGQSINVTVTFSEAVSLTGGNLAVTLNTGGQAVIAPFSSASIVMGTYTVSAGQNTTHLTANSPLQLAGGAALRDAAGQNATLTIPSGQNIGDSRNIVISTGTTPVPLPPTNVRATGFGSVIDVEWDASPSTNVIGYNIYRKVKGTDPWPSTPINSGGAIPGTKYRDSTGLSAGVTYVYRVTAVGN
jgi:fibronectin type 3 domain-containing protein